MLVKPFVVITYPRSGTHMLRTALNQHPQIAVAGELLNPNKQDLPYPLTLPTAEILEQYAFAEQDNVECAGFVHHAYHPGIQQTWPDNRGNPVWQDIWELLSAIPQLKIIHLYRQNLVWRHLSQVLARQTGHWQAFIDADTAQAQGKQYQPKPATRQSICLDAQLMQQDFQETINWRKHIRQIFAHHPILEVAYEDLCIGFDHQIGAILDFLSLAQHGLAPELIKLEDRRMLDAIKNYHLLKSQFADTDWADFFID